jgi:hypothetical protein
MNTKRILNMKFSCKRKLKKYRKAFYMVVHYHDNGFESVKIKDILFVKKQVRLKKLRKGNTNSYDLSTHVSNVFRWRKQETTTQQM